jgi:hypothetical protein
VARFPNCFQPHGLGLRPPLRRDVLRRMFATDARTVTWLAAGPDQRVVPNSVPGAAFRPLAQAVKYLVEADPALIPAVSPWPVFEFSDFAVIAERPVKVQKPRTEFDATQDVEIRAASPPAAPVNVVKGKAPIRHSSAPGPASAEKSLPRLPVMSDAELRKRLAELQRAFLDGSGPPDSPARQALWPELAELHGATQHQADAAVCWGYALWDVPAPPPEWLHAWLRAERDAAGVALTADRLDQILTESSPRPEMVRHLAAGLVASLALPPTPHLRARAAAIPPFLERHESALPVRVAWLAWRALVRMTGNDVLALARARDRLLQKVLDIGLSRDRDLPAFLRDRGAGTGVDHARLADIHRKANEWAAVADKVKSKSRGEYQPLVNLTFAFGFAQIGESNSTRELVATAHRQIPDDHAVLNWLGRAYEYRIGCVLAKQSHAGGLPPALLHERAALPASEGAAMDRYRRVSRILEPFERIDPYRNLRAWGARRDAIGEAISRLADVVDSATLGRDIQALKKKANPQSAVKVLAAALTFAPRVGDAFAAEILADLDQVIRTAPLDQNLFQAVELLESAMLLAAHLGRDERVPPLFQALRDLLRPLHGERLSWLVGHLNGELFRTLGKLGLRDHVQEMVDQLFGRMLEERSLAALRVAPAVNWGIVLRALLQLAGGWFYTGRDGPATEVLDEVADKLKARTLRDEEQANLAAAYATTLGQAPPVVTWPRIHDLFDHLAELDVPHANTRYHHCVFRTIESALLAVVTKDFAAGGAVRRWLDEDEHLVRRRIHADLRREISKKS